MAPLNPLLSTNSFEFVSIVDGGRHQDFAYQDLAELIFAKRL
jgi:hypothetical protein